MIESELPMHQVTLSPNHPSPLHRLPRKGRCPRRFTGLLWYEKGLLFSSPDMFVRPYWLREQPDARYATYADTLPANTLETKEVSKPDPQ